MSQDSDVTIKVTFNIDGDEVSVIQVTARARHVNERVRQTIASAFKDGLENTVKGKVRSIPPHRMVSAVWTPYVVNGEEVVSDPPRRPAPSEPIWC